MVLELILGLLQIKSQTKLKKIILVLANIFFLPLKIETFLSKNSFYFYRFLIVNIKIISIIFFYQSIQISHHQNLVDQKSLIFD